MDINIDIEDIFVTALEWLASTGLKVGLALVFILLANRIVIRISSKIIHNIIINANLATKVDEQRREATVKSLINVTLTVIIWVTGVIMLLSSLGVNVGPLIAGAGVLGFAVGFGAQELVKDFIAGVFIIMENQYRVGDWVSLDGTSGVVEEITIRTTVLRDLDGHQHHIPNGQITTATNKSIDYNDINMVIGVSYDCDIAHVEKIVNKVGLEFAKDEEWSKYIHEPPYFLRVNNFGDSSVDIKIMGKVKPGRQWSVAGELRKRFKAAFDKEKIEIPYPQRTIHQK